MRKMFEARCYHDAARLNLVAVRRAGNEVFVFSCLIQSLDVDGQRRNLFLFLKPFSVRVEELE